MELVDANTKNYVFLTLSQYNNEQNLVRTRVSMRRDQPFWDGGNSYICCESFRVSASPSQGGLYYKVFPYEWYMGCKLPQDLSEPGDTDADWEKAVHAGTSGNPHEVGQVLMASNNSGTIENNTYKARLNVWGCTDQMQIGSLQTQDPLILRTYLDIYLNKYMLWNKSWARISVDTGADGNNEGYITGQCQGNPAFAVQGNGLGVDKMYYPHVEMAHAVTFLPSLATLAALAENEVINQPFTVSLKCLAQPNTAPGLNPPMPSTEFANLVQQVGQKLFLQVRTGAAVPRDWTPPVYGGIFNVTGLVGVQYHFQQRFFPNTNVSKDDKTMGTCTGAPIRQMQWDKLAVGATCWITITDDDPVADFDAGTYYGHIEQITEPNSGDFALYTTATKALWDWAKANTSAATRTSLLEQSWLISTSPEPINAAIHSSMTLNVTKNVNLPDPPFPAPAAVSLATNRDQNQRVCIRRPDSYIYTPNEMFYAFNHEETIGETKVHLPYKVQTDENGGFAIWWNSEPNSADSFVISVGLSEALGLNTYFEYDFDEHIGDVGHNVLYVRKVNYDAQDHEDEPAVWIEAHDLSLERDTYTAVPLPPPAGIQGEPLILWGWLDKVQYTFVRSHQYTERQFQTVKRKIYPTLHTDGDNVPFYRYNNLPSVGVIRNTQMVSVESFSTYSEITLVIPNLPFQSMLGTSSDERILASLRLPFENGTVNNGDGAVVNTTFGYYGDLIFNTLASRSYLKVTTDQALYDCDVEVRLIRRDGQMDVMQLPYQGEFQVKLRLLQTQ